ncbi:MAG: CPBP family intramembrane glutamic endopeptidase [Terracidiphilus sp.]
MSSLPEELPPDPNEAGSPEHAFENKPLELWPLPPLPPEAQPLEIRPAEAAAEDPAGTYAHELHRAETPSGSTDDLTADLKGTGFSPYVDRTQQEWALAPEVASPQTALAAEQIPAPPERPPFDSFYQPEIRQPTRIPHLGHLLMLALLLIVGIAADFVAVPIALHFHLFDVTTAQDAMTEIHYTLGSEAILYLVTLAGCVLIFPLMWRMSFFDGISWHAATARRLSPMLIGAAFVCFLLALVNGWLMPGPPNAPIDKMFRVPGAAWLLFGFGVTFAPFFEELVFRGFLLPALSTACDWIGEKATGNPQLPLAADGLPQWSLPAMAIASILTSLPFAGMHAAQTGYSLGPFLLLVGVSLVLCAARLLTRSLAASVLVHASYNFMLFSLMLFGTGGFRHLENM